VDKWRTIKEHRVFEHPILSLTTMLRQREDGYQHDIVRLSSLDWVNVVAITPEREIVLIKQWRHGSDEVTLEIPGGLVDQGEDPSLAGPRELAEETGYKSGNWRKIGWTNPNPALFGNTCHTYLALDASLAGPPRPDEAEEIEVFTRPLSDLPDLLKEGKISNCLVVTALAWLWLDGAVPGLALPGQL